jgi:hypothetical protein
VGHKIRRDVPEEIKQALSYDPKTGLFTWLVRRNGSRSGEIMPGSVAGWVRRVDGYRVIGFTDDHGVFRQFKAHRLAFWFMTGEMPDEVDHDDRNRDNNRWANLRAATSSMNNHNSTHRKDNTSGTRGVSWDAEKGMWRAYVNLDRKRTWLGRFATIKEATAARREAELSHLGRSSPS